MVAGLTQDLGLCSGAFRACRGHLSKNNSQRLKHLWLFGSSQTNKRRRRAATTRIRRDGTWRKKKAPGSFHHNRTLTFHSQSNWKSNRQHQNLIKLHPVRRLCSQIYLSPKDNVSLDRAGLRGHGHRTPWELRSDRKSTYKIKMKLGEGFVSVLVPLHMSLPKNDPSKVTKSRAEMSLLIRKHWHGRKTNVGS